MKRLLSGALIVASVVFPKTTSSSTVICARAIVEDKVTIAAGALSIDPNEQLGIAPVLSMGLEQASVATGTSFSRFLTFLLAQVPGGIPNEQRLLQRVGGWDLRELENFAISPDRTRVAFSQRGNGPAPFYLFDSQTGEFRSAAVNFDSELATRAWEEIASNQFSLPEKLVTGGTEGVVARMERQAMGRSGIFPFRHMHFSPDGKKLVVDAGTVFSVFDGYTLELLYQFTPGLPVIGAAWFMGEGRFILTVHELGLDGGNANVVMLWNAQTGKFLRTQKIDTGFIPSWLSGYGGAGGNIPGRGISPPDIKGRYWVRTIEVPPNLARFFSMQRQERAVATVGAPPDSPGTESSNAGTERALWDAFDQRPDYRETNVWTVGVDQHGPKLVKATSFRGSRDYQHYVVFSAVDRAAVGTPHGSVEVFDLPDWTKTHTLRLDGRNDPIRAVIISKDGTQIAAVTKGGHLAFWTIEGSLARGLGYLPLGGDLYRWENDATRSIRAFFSTDKTVLNIYIHPDEQDPKHITVRVPH